MRRAIITAIIFLAFLTACDNEGNHDDSVVNTVPSSPADTYTIAYSSNGPDISRLLGWQWAKDDSEFIWLFKSDGTVSVIHCCGDVYPKQFNYLLRGSVLITYGSEVSFDEMEATTFIMTDDGDSFTRDNGTIFTRGEADTGSSAASPLVLSNDLLGTWQGEDGTEYAFSADAGLLITPSGGVSGQYGYLARYAELLTLGPLVDGTPAALQKYWFNRTGNALYLHRSDGVKYTLSLAE